MQEQGKFPQIDISKDLVPAFPGLHLGNVIQARKAPSLNLGLGI